MTASAAFSASGAVLTNDTRRDDLIAVAKELGSNEGAGVNSRPELAMKVVEYARVGAIGTDDTKDVWREFLAARAARKGDNRSREDATDRDPQKSFKAQVSKLNQFVRAGALTGVDFGEVLGRAKSYIDANPALSGSTFDNMVTIARTQLSKDHKDAPLTDDQIKEALAPKPSEDKTELDYLKGVAKELEKIHDGTEKDGVQSRPAFASEEVRNALAWVNRRISVLELVKQEQELMLRRARLSPQPAPVQTTQPEQDDKDEQDEQDEQDEHTEEHLQAAE